MWVEPGDYQRPLERVVAGNTGTERANSRGLSRDLYVRTGAYPLVNYKVLENFEVAGGVKNLLDQNCELASGLPQQGRTFEGASHFLVLCGGRGKEMRVLWRASPASRLQPAQKR